MLVYFLGTGGAGKPSLERNVTSIALRLPASAGDVWLFDCGEGTQHQLWHHLLACAKSPVFSSPISTAIIFLAYRGLLASRSFSAKDIPLALYGPPGIRRFVDTALDLSSTRLSYPLRFGS